MSSGVCGALDEDTEDGPTEEGGGAECEEGSSEEELGSRQSAEEGVIGPEDGSCPADWAQAALPPPVAFGDCLSRMFIVLHVLQMSASSAIHSHFIVSSLPVTASPDVFIGSR